MKRPTADGMEDPQDFLRHLTQGIEDARDKTRDWMGVALKSHMRRRFPTMTESELNSEMKTFVEDTTGGAQMRDVLVTDGHLNNAIIARVSTVKDAEAVIAALETVVPDDVRAARYSIDASEMAVNGDLGNGAIMKITEAAERALECQNGVNLSGILGSFHSVVTEAIRPEARRLGKGTDWVNRHPVCTLFLDKLADLNCPWRQVGTLADFGPAYDECVKLAAGEPEEKS